MTKFIFLVLSIICLVYSVSDLNIALENLETPSLVIIDCTRALLLGLTGLFSLSADFLLILGDNLAEKINSLGQRS
jgi:hypothetical protein